ncbi:MULTISPECIES: DUF4255 domain-containing protein [Streptomyces]|uniref:DUF4255 domain-containing protein n=4 Tax=Streptomyces TaxID=1883 RepID=A0AAX3ZK97_STRRO|nr:MULTISPECIES: DUF4255 domain-containing protein [Streptomyces]MBD2817104.1 DUF4255 domain-containing protein [Streptomyces parvulus]MDV6289367.1 DUF4255 domain-containing protein [Streptomyces sp. UP1A-1]WDI19093.1 DUF4255 domain-containing protein [Streptomyces enissocaesilis]MBJ6620167.1 DUF4255 domain-containing protein [Streptomyces sp. DHE17-7]MBU8550429.1 DUF4255 domain-containing protein [Streptomyces sp. Osf17]
MIHEVDEVLKRLLGGGALAGSGIDVSFEAPTRDWAARRNAPSVNAYLYDIREDVARRQRGQMAVRDQDDIVVRRRQPPRWFRLSYLVTAWTKTPQDEHRLLSAVLATLLPRELLPPAELPGSLGELGLSVPLTVAGIQTESRSLAEIWSALGGELKPSLDLVVTAPFPAFPEYDAGPPVTEGATVRVRDLADDTAEPVGRSHRPHQVAAARAARAAARGTRAARPADPR